MSDSIKKGQEVRLAEVTDFIQYGYTAKSSKSAEGPKYLRITDIQNDQVDWTGVPYATINPEDAARYRLRPGDIVFARTAPQAHADGAFSETLLDAHGVKHMGALHLAGGAGRAR